MIQVPAVAVDCELCGERFDRGRSECPDCGTRAPATRDRSTAVAWAAGALAVAVWIGTSATFLVVGAARDRADVGATRIARVADERGAGIACETTLGVMTDASAGGASSVTSTTFGGAAEPASCRTVDAPMRR